MDQDLFSLLHFKISKGNFFYEFFYDSRCSKSSTDFAEAIWIKPIIEKLLLWGMIYDYDLLICFDQIYESTEPEQLEIFNKS